MNEGLERSHATGLKRLFRSMRPLPTLQRALRAAMHPAAPAIPGWPSLEPLPGAAEPQRLHTPEAQPVAWWKVQQEAERRAAQELEDDRHQDRHHHQRHREERGGRRRGRRRGRSSAASSSGSGSSSEAAYERQPSPPPLSQARLAMCRTADQRLRPVRPTARPASAGSSLGRPSASASANRRLCSGWPAIPSLLFTQARLQEMAELRSQLRAARRALDEGARHEKALRRALRRTEERVVEALPRSSSTPPPGRPRSSGSRLQAPPPTATACLLPGTPTSSHCLPPSSHYPPPPTTYLPLPTSSHYPPPPTT